MQIVFLEGSKVTEFDFMRIEPLSRATLRPHVWPRLESGEMKVVIHHVFPLADAAAAHRMMEESRHVRKILLRVRSWSSVS